MQINLQPIEKPTKNANILEVHSIFYTIQGEGPFAGSPAIFVRLAGCNLQCPGCDTDYTSNRRFLTTDAICREVISKIPPAFNSNHSSGPIVVITGGEPFRQDLSKLLHQLVMDWAFVVQVETNGTVSFGSIPESVVIVCSPKTAKLHRDNLGRINAFKYVLHHEGVSSADGLPTHALFHSSAGSLARPPEEFFGVIYVQPMDCKDEKTNKLNQDAAVKSCLDFGYVLQLQIHKIIGVE